LLKILKPDLISRDIRHNSEEEERVKLIIIKEKDLLFKIIISITLLNIDSFQELHAEKLFARLLMQLLKVIELLLKLILQN